MGVRELWGKERERQFLLEALKHTSPDRLFYLEGGKYRTYWSRNYRGPKGTLQSRNSLIGEFTERWVRDLLEEVARESGLYAVRHLVCEEIGLSPRSPADIALCREKRRFPISHQLSNYSHCRPREYPHQEGLL
ncbi:MAG: hypothetical protein GXO19_05110 [Epsilonproteobacteria bacterium]|nr:hypothetical protein [Campylobacterota bacterium]NPA57097.1 hypothetical protein [Campylobacterota bacterium]